MSELWIKGWKYNTSSTTNLNLSNSKYNGNPAQYGQEGSAKLNDRSVEDINSTYPYFWVADYQNKSNGYNVLIGHQNGWYIDWYPTSVLPTAYIKINFNSGIGERTYTWNGTSNCGKFPTATKTGYTHTHWEVDGGTYEKNITVTSNWISGYRTYGTLTATAVWSANKYTITFNANQGSGGPGPQTKTYDSPLTLSSVKPTRTGYDFVHWNTKSNDTGTSYDAGGSFSTNITNDITLYAIWKPSTSKILTATDVTLSTTNNVTPIITWKPNESSFKFKIKAQIPQSAGTAASIGPIQVNNFNSLDTTDVYTYQDSVNFSFPSTWIKYITTAKSTICTLTLQTFNDSEISLGSETYNITISTPEGINPTVSFNNNEIDINGTPEFKDANNNFAFTILDKIKIPWNFSPWRMESEDADNYTSPLKEIEAKTDGANSLKAISGTSGWLNSDITLQTYGQKTITLQATDQRTNSSNIISKSINVYNYNVPNISIKYIPGGFIGIDGISYFIPHPINSTTNLNPYTVKLSIYADNSSTPITGFNELDITSDIKFYRSDPSDPATTLNPIGETYNLYYDFSQADARYDLNEGQVPDLDTTSYRFVVTLTDSKNNITTSSAYSAIPVMTFGAGGSKITAHKPMTFEQGIQPMDTSDVSGVEILPTRTSDELGGRIKLDRGVDTSRDAYIDTYDAKLRFIDRNPSTVVRASLDLTDGYFDAGGYKINGTNVVDFPVEYGTSNGWRYRKWNSGWFEAWHNRIGEDIPANQSMVLFKVNFPFTLPSVDSLYAITFGSYQNTTAASNASIFDVSTWTTTQLSIRAFRNYTDTANWGISPRCCIQIQGRWK